ncbi:DEAD/DEAH box helicase [Synoicihabitans lomoniglobus]|uniref:DEAD/DEAH box helicase n=1 Tax=Synoicihabitans lomoniglobus TaxID=2909285 RepID=A0AAE9ZT36_9BACT|nr:DEAD/DEAH box helicase [Opitutaceae bacterium LMO-M01]WED63766.1 DEAD/DEAH box helicase [Opitutaceae bacterium LMO-M01]
MPFTALGLSTHLIRALSQRSYVAPTPVQTEAIPAILRGADVWAQAQTGSGKTAAFALPLLQHGAEISRSSRRNTPVLVLVPTRELAAQVAQAFSDYGQYLTRPPKVITAAGGVSINPQMMALGGGADVVVATPGRLLDLVDHNAVHLDAVETLVLDEADQLFALGFADELGRILALLPAKRQNLLFSATFPDEVTDLATALLTDPVRITIASTPVTTPAITERAIEVDAPRRTQLLRQLLETHDGWTRVLVFVATKYSTGHVAEKLRRLGIEAGSLHGELSQGARTQTLADFAAGKIPVLIATDLAARGIDFTQLSVVINYDLPRSAIIYTHRIGRTGRAGATGEAISFVSAATFELFQLIEKRLKRLIPREQIPGFEPAEVAPPEAPRTGGVKGKRKSKKDKLREAAGLPPGTPLNSPGAAAATPASSSAPRPKPASTPRPTKPKSRPSRPPREDSGGRESTQLESSENAFRWHRAPPGRRRL